CTCFQFRTDVFCLDLGRFILTRHLFMKVLCILGHVEGGLDGIVRIRFLCRLDGDAADTAFKVNVGNLSVFAFLLFLGIYFAAKGEQDKAASDCQAQSSTYQLHRLSLPRQVLDSLSRFAGTPRDGRGCFLGCDERLASHTSTASSAKSKVTSKRLVRLNLPD